MWVADYLFDMNQQGRVVFQKDIEAEFSINRATASKMLSLMEKKHLIKRTNDVNDSRLKQIELEPMGLELQRLCCYIQQELEKTLQLILRNKKLPYLRHFVFACLNTYDFVLLK